MKIILKICFSLFVISSFLTSCTPETEKVLLQDMERFDQAFIPVFYYVKLGEMDKAKKSIYFLNHTWQKTTSKYQISETQNKDYQRSWQTVDALLSNAYAAINMDANREAYTFLDRARYQMIDFRQQRGLAYFLDPVWEYEAELNLIKEIVTDPMMCLLEQKEFEEIVVKLNQAWYATEYTSFDNTLFNKNNKAFYKLKKKMKKDLQKFNDAVRDAEGEEMVVMSKLLEENYLEYLMHFGDFVNPRTYVATR